MVRHRPPTSCNGHSGLHVALHLQAHPHRTTRTWSCLAALKESSQSFLAGTVASNWDGAMTPVMLLQYNCKLALILKWP